MNETTQTLSVVINAPAEDVWPLLIGWQQSNAQEMVGQQYLHREPEGPPVPGQVSQMKRGCLRMSISIDSVIQAESPLIGQTIEARISFLGRRGEIRGCWTGDASHYHLQSQAEVKHLWVEYRYQRSIHCAILDSTSCVVVSVEQSAMTSRLLPRWLTHRLDQNGAVEKATTKAMETSLQRIKAKAEEAEETSDNHPL